jgi:ABC-type transporter Mla subunit MlaD
MSTVAALQHIIGTLQQVSSSAGATADRVTAATDRIAAAATEAQRHAGEVDRIVGELEGRVATRADDLLYQMRRLADEGNLWAEQLEGIIQHVQEGLIPADQAIHAFGDAMIVFDGQLRSVRDVLSDVLPTTGQVQERIRELIAELKAEGAGIEEVTARLAQQANSYARELAEMVRLMQQGRLTLEQIRRRAQELEKLLPGSETAALSGFLADLLENADARGRLG